MTSVVIPTKKIFLPSGCNARPGKLADYHLAFELVNTYSRHVNGRDDLTDAELVRLDWQNADFKPETDLHLVFNQHGLLIGMVECWLDSQPPVHPWNWVCVHPDYLDTNLWEYLLSWSEERSKAALGLVSAEFRVAPHTGTEHHNLAGIETIRKLGWTHVRSYYRMEVKLETQPQVPPIPAGIVIRPYDPETETEAVYNTFVDSFKDHYGFVAQPFEHGFANFKHNMIDEPGYDPNFWFVAVDGDTIAGICICRPVSAEDSEGGWVSELGVRRAWRKKGLGTLLLKTAFAAFYKRGQKRAGLGVDASSLTGALRLYEQAGMQVSRQYDNFEKELRPGRELATQELV